MKTPPDASTRMPRAENASRRPHCARCERPQRTCICHWIVPTENEVEVLFLQHPLEVGHAKGSAGLLHCSLRYSTLVIGERFEAEELQALLYAPLHSGAIPLPALLYPSSDVPQEKAAAASLPNRLVILDGTWRKSRKMLYLNPLLRDLSRISLNGLSPSHYRIRKAHRIDQLSSCEAACHALARLESNEDRYAPMLDAFDGFVSQQASYVPRSRT